MKTPNVSLFAEGNRLVAKFYCEDIPKLQPVLLSWGQRYFAIDTVTTLNVFQYKETVLPHVYPLEPGKNCEIVEAKQ